MSSKMIPINGGTPACTRDWGPHITAHFDKDDELVQIEVRESKLEELEEMLEDATITWLLDHQ